MYIVYSSPDEIKETKLFVDKVMTDSENENNELKSLVGDISQLENQEKIAKYLVKEGSNMERKCTKKQIAKEVGLGAAYLVAAGLLGYSIYKQKHRNSNTCSKKLHLQHNTTNNSHINITSDNTSLGIVPTVSSHNLDSKAGHSVSKSSTSDSKSDKLVAKANYLYSCMKSKRKVKKSTIYIIIATIVCIAIIAAIFTLMKSKAKPDKGKLFTSMNKYFTSNTENSNLIGSFNPDTSLNQSRIQSI